MKNDTCRIREIHDVLRRTYPDTRSDLLEPHRDKPMDVLIATILSQATNDNLSGKAFEGLKSAYPDWENVLKEDPPILERILAVGGLQREKTKKIQGTLAKIKEDFGRISLEPIYDRSPSEIQKYLLTLPGVGPKTAACVLVFGLNIPAFPVDTHVYRISKRLGLIDKENTVRAQAVLEEMVPPELKKDLHLLIIRHGREICHARKPKCSSCMLKPFCNYEE